MGWVRFPTVCTVGSHLISLRYEESECKRRRRFRRSGKSNSSHSECSSPHPSFTSGSLSSSAPPRQRESGAKGAEKPVGWVRFPSVSAVGSHLISRLRRSGKSNSSHSEYSSLHPSLTSDPSASALRPDRKSRGANGAEKPVGWVRFPTVYSVGSHLISLRYMESECTRRGRFRRSVWLRQVACPLAADLI